MDESQHSHSATGTLARASMADAVRFTGKVVLPMLAGGLIARRPRAMAAIERWQLDRTAVAALQRLRRRYGPGPLRLRVAGRSLVLLLAPADVQHVLAESPEPFTPASREKVGALAHFQPHGLLISRGNVRTQRRHFNETVLEADRPLHRLSESVLAKTRAEFGLVSEDAGSAGHLDWEMFSTGWWRTIRRITLGDGARDAENVTDLLGSIRADANWAYLRAARTGLRHRFLRELRTHIDAAESDSLAALLRETPAEQGVDRHGQVPHWLFAFDAAAIVAFRALALLATHPQQARQARAELAGLDLSRPQELPYLRACLLESVRLWPTTPAVLRQNITAIPWHGRMIPSGTSFLVFTPFFHRDRQTVPHAHEFAPDIWLDGRAADHPALVPFSDGAARCPGRNLVLFVAGTVLATLLQRHRFHLRAPARLDADHPLPFSLNNYGLDFAVEPIPR
ncbi:cytochrome P450 [Haloactinomyces albus]|uniref:Cytochrome P450 n=1 Tax=Haloactinomyces albus TaxID=1352928 RepID=A0AAE3ZB89_9ACTN|nr:cytochrome P450 [Haloactinomyces albus]MDR7299939.1 cytochrome P450 [Haloactinomyces albus]